MRLKLWLSSAPLPDSKTLKNLDCERTVDIEIEFGDTTERSRIDDLHLSCEQMQMDFDQMDEEEELEVKEVETALKDSVFVVGISKNDFMHSQQIFPSIHLWAHCIAHLLELVIKGCLNISA